MTGHREFSAALLDPERTIPDGITTWNGSDPAARFAVHRNNVAASLVEALTDTFPVTQELVGETFFRAMAVLFVRIEPPRSPVLAHYGASFPSFIEHFPPAASVPYLGDVARLERLRMAALHARDADELPASNLVSAMADIDALPELRVLFNPSVGLLRSRYAVASLWAAHQGLIDIATVDPDVAEDVLVVRPDLEVEVIPLRHGAAVFIDHLLQRGSLGSALEQASRAYPRFDLADILRQLVRARAISSLTPEGIRSNEFDL
jgi:hypothetical protein